MIMKIIWNKIIPFPGYVCMTVFYWIFAREEFKEQGLRPETINHESIHIDQQEDFIIPIIGGIIFYLWYVLEWICKLPFALVGYKPYRSISFEQEAYEHEDDLNYLKDRKKFNWLKYVFKLVK